MQNLERLDPERQVRAIAAHLLEQIPDALTLLQELLANASTDAGRLALLRMWQDSAAAVTQGFSPDRPLDVDMKVVTEQLFAGETYPVRADGSRVMLPIGHALALTLFVKASVAELSPTKLTVTFQQAHQELLLQIKLDGKTAAQLSADSRRLLEFVAAKLDGRIETPTQTRQVIRLHFPRPTDNLLAPA